MAGIGVKLNKIFKQETISANLVGYSYSLVATILPMLSIIGAVALMHLTLDYKHTQYSGRWLVSDTLLYICIFSLIICSPLNSVLSKFLSDVVCDEKYDDVMPCYYVGLFLSTLVVCIVGMCFCLWEYFVGKVPINFVFAGYCGFVSLTFVFYSMIYLIVCKDYVRISRFFLEGMGISVILSWIFVYLFNVDLFFSMLVSIDAGFLIIAILEFALVKSYFRENSRNYQKVFDYLRRHKKLMLANFFFILGLFIHNFVFWSTDMHTVVASTFVSAINYDLATFLSMITNMTVNVIFIVRLAMEFHFRYKEYMEAVIGGRGIDIDRTKQRMFRIMSEELVNTARWQFIITLIGATVMSVILPAVGMTGQTMRIYPCMCTGYFILFIMYCGIMFLYYLDDTIGALLASLTFCLNTFIVAFIATRMPDCWYGLGVTIGAFSGWCVVYYRLQRMEKRIDAHIFWLFVKNSG